MRGGGESGGGVHGGDERAGRGAGGRRLWKPQQRLCRKSIGPMCVSKKCAMY